MLVHHHRSAETEFLDGRSYGIYSSVVQARVAFVWFDVRKLAHFDLHTGIRFLRYLSHLSPFQIIYIDLLFGIIISNSTKNSVILARRQYIPTFDIKNIIRAL